MWLLVFWNIVRNAISRLLSNIVSFFSPKRVIKFDNGQSVTISRKIAEGGFSYIYLATDKHDRKYALKRIMCNDDEVIEQCKKEAEVHRSVEGVNVLSLYDIKFCNSPQRVCYMLFPHILGGSLRDETNKRNVLLDNMELARPIPERQVLKTFLGVLNGIKCMHYAGWAHADIKLENVLLDKTHNNDEEIGTMGSQDLGTPVLMDFGSARKPLAIQLRDRRTVLTLTEEASMNSTISYRAPELFDGGCRHGPLEADIDGKIDVWSCGCLLYGMMYGASPFELEFRNGQMGMSSDVKIVECTHLRVLACKIPYPAVNSRREAIFQYTPEIKQLIEWMLTVNRVERPSIDQVYDRVEAMMSKKIEGII